MSERKTKALNVMLNAFPAGHGDLKLRLNTYLHLVAELSDGAVLEACRRFSSGECGRPTEEQRFAPSVAEFCHVARDVENQIRLKENPPITARVEIKRSASSLRFQERVQIRIAQYRRTYSEAKAKDPSLKYVDHIIAEHRAGTGRALHIPRPDREALLNAQMAKQDAVFADELERVHQKHFGTSKAREAAA